MAFSLPYDAEFDNFMFEYDDILSIFMKDYTEGGVEGGRGYH